MRRGVRKGLFMGEVLIRPDENVAAHMHRELGPFEHLLWLVDQWTPCHFIAVSRIEGQLDSGRESERSVIAVFAGRPNPQTANGLKGEHNRVDKMEGP